MIRGGPPALVRWAHTASSSAPSASPRGGQLPSQAGRGPIANGSRSLETQRGQGHRRQAGAPQRLPSGVCPEASLGSGEPENFHTQRPRQLAECGDAGLGGPGLAGARRLHLGQCFPNPPHGRPQEPVSLGQARPGLLASGCSEWHAWKTLPKHGSGQVRAYDVWTLHCPVTFLPPPAPPRAQYEKEPSGASLCPEPLLCSRLGPEIVTPRKRLTPTSTAGRNRAPQVD